MPNQNSPEYRALREDQLPEAANAPLRWCFVIGALTLVLMFSPFNFDFRGDWRNLWMRLEPKAWMAAAMSASLFVPFGFVNCWLARAMNPGHVGVVAIVVGDSLALGLIGESIQTFLPGSLSSVVDLGAHVVGGVVGALVHLHLVPVLACERLRR